MKVQVAASQTPQIHHARAEPVLSCTCARNPRWMNSLRQWIFRKATRAMSRLNEQLSFSASIFSNRLSCMFPASPRAASSRQDLGDRYRPRTTYPLSRQARVFGAGYHRCRFVSSGGATGGGNSELWPHRLCERSNWKSKNCSASKRVYTDAFATPGNSITKIVLYIFSDSLQLPRITKSHSQDVPAI
jgi:hypothetical protein